jgi:CheY-like chemotaxis protein
MATVLVADDDASVRRVLQRALAREGYEVRCAGDGAEALEFIEADAPDLVVTDINMPDMDGIELLIQVARRGGIKVIAISGGGLFPAHELLEDARLFGAVDILPKPFDIAVLLERVAAALRSG